MRGQRSSSSTTSGLYDRGIEGGVFYTARPNNFNGLDTARDNRAAFMTARSRGTESELELETTRGLETARDTARESDTGYMSTFEPETSRSIEDIEGDLEAGARERNAPAYSALPYRKYCKPVSENRAEPTEKRADNWKEKSRAVSRNNLTGENRTRPRYSSTTSSSNNHERHGDRPRRSAEIRHDHSTAWVQQLQQQSESGSNRVGYFGFQQSAVEDVFSYARHNRVEEVERMMDQGVPVDVRDGHGNTILIVACQNGHKRILKAALRRGADLNAINTRGNTALHFCHAFGYGDTLGRYLMDKGADSSIRNNNGMVCYDGIGH